MLSEGAASLLPNGPRPAVIFTVRVDPEGAVRLEGAERAIIRSAAKLAYESVSGPSCRADFGELSRRIEAAEARRGAARVDPPEQEVVALGGGRYELAFRPMSKPEQRNAALSLAANLAIADDAAGSSHRAVSGDGRAGQEGDQAAAADGQGDRPRLAAGRFAQGI